MTETNNSTVNVNPLQGENSPAVLAYRVGQAEQAIREGFQAISLQLREMSDIFATHKDVAAVTAQAKLEHAALSEEIQDVKKDVEKLQKKGWVNSTLSAILGAIIALLVAYAVNGMLN
jgi:hypothetical protein